MLAWMERTGDPMLDCFRHRDDPEFLAAYMTKIEEEASGRGKPNRRQNREPRARRNAQLIQMQIPKTASAGEIVVISIAHTLPKRLGEQQIHVTLKDGNGQRIERQVLKATGEGRVTAQFKIPADVPGGKVQLAAFIGPDFQNHLQHVTPNPIDVK